MRPQTQRIARFGLLTALALILGLAAGVQANYKNMVLNHAISPLENPSQIKKLRRTIARMKTELRERELNNK